MANFLSDIFGGGGGGSTVQPIDVTPLENLVKQRAQTQKGIVGTETGSLQGLNTALLPQVNAAQQAGATSAANRSAQFLKDIGQQTNIQGQQLSDILKQRVLGAVPEAQAAARESLAATGGLQRGYAGATLAGIPQTAVANIAQGETQLTQQALNTRNQALNQVYNLDEQYIMDKTGVDKQTLLDIYNSGRSDLINNANQLLGIESGTTSDIIGLEEFKASQTLAQQQAAAANRQATLNALLGIGGTAIGAFAGGIPGAIAGSNLAPAGYNPNVTEDQLPGGQ